MSVPFFGSLSKAELDIVLVKSLYPLRLWGEHEHLCTDQGNRHTCLTPDRKEDMLLFPVAIIPSPASSPTCPGCHLATHHLSVSVAPWA